ncbi:MAG: hypothetical protein V1837_02650 [Candidatus Woesearchaeota archaeon]
MPIFSLKKEKKDDAKGSEVPDELPSLSEPEISPPKPQVKQDSKVGVQPIQANPLVKPVEPSPELPKLEPEPFIQQPVAAPVATFVMPEDPEPSQPKKLIDHINLIDKLRGQLTLTEFEINQLGKMLSDKHRFLGELRAELESEVLNVKVELGLEQRKPMQQMVASQQEPRRPVVVSPDKAFCFADGSRATSLLELYEKLRFMPDSVFSAYCNEQKNDFYLWITEFFKDDLLAFKLKPLTSRQAVIQVLADFLT